MNYNLGVMDISPISLNGTSIENNPCIQVVFKEMVDKEKLENSVNAVLMDFPLFKTKICYDNGYYLKSNNNDIIIINAEFSKRPLSFGKNTNDYPWQITYFEKTISFEWCHCITDGHGAFDFLFEIIKEYHGIIREKIKTQLELGIEGTFYDSIKSKNVITQPKGFRAKSLPYNKKAGYTTKCHTLETSTDEVLSVARNNGATPVTVIAPLFSKALRQHINKNVKNRNVACSVVIDERKIFGYNTMHNFITAKTITYCDDYDDMPFSNVCKNYRNILNSYCSKENMVEWNTKIIKQLSLLISIKPLFLNKLVVNFIAKILKHSEVNFGITYIRCNNLPTELIEKIEKINLKVWHDYGESNISAIDFNGRFIVNIAENYIDDTIIDSFIRESEQVGIHWTKTNFDNYTQANFRNKI